MSNQVQARKPTFTMAINTEGYKKLINNTLGDSKRAARFIAGITSAVVTTPGLQDCTPQSIISGGFLGDALNLSPSPQLGQYYLVPYNDTKTGNKVAQFQVGYKGYCQLAMKSGFYKKINVASIKEGELIKADPINEEFEFRAIEDVEARENAETIGYYASFEYLNGFRKAIYWSRAKMEKHALQYSQGYKAKKGYTFWEKNFDAMAEKTMIRQLISKWGMMSTEIEEAIIKDTAVIHEDGTYDYVDTPEDKEIINQAEPEEKPLKLDEI